MLRELYLAWLISTPHYVSICKTILELEDYFNPLKILQDHQ